MQPPLRTRLVALLLVLVAAALVLAGAAAAAALRGYLYAQVDRGLVEVAAAMAETRSAPPTAHSDVPGLGPWARTCSTCGSPTPPGWLPPRDPPRCRHRPARTVRP